jgi:zinc protease
MNAPISVATLQRINAGQPRRLRFTAENTLDFNGRTLERFTLGNGLRVLVLADDRAPVVSYNTWYRVGSRHEREGKTGLAHLFEHLMFNETKNLPAGRFDTLLERAGAETNAATWNDWTYYYENVPADQLALVVRLEAERMNNLVLRAGPVKSEKEVVANERRYRVEDDIDGLVSEVLWSKAYTAHPYHHPTIGWMKDIEGFTPADCRAFYKTWYAPNNATLVVVGDVKVPRLLRLVRGHYGPLSASKIPVESLPVEPAQRAERREVIERPAASDRVAVGYKCPGLDHPDHAALSVLVEALTGGRSSRFYRELVTERELASDLSGWASTFRDPGLWELSATARSGVSADALLAALDTATDRLRRHPVTAEERERAVARFELSMLRGLETVAGRAETIGFHDTVLGDPLGAMERLRRVRAVTVEDLAGVVRSYLRDARRTVVLVRSTLNGEAAA